MPTILSRTEPIEQYEEFSTTSTTSIYRAGDRSHGHLIAIIRPVPSIAQTSAKDINSVTKSYYLSARLTDFSNTSLPSQPYELGSVNEQSEELRSYDIAVHDLARPIEDQNVTFVQTLPNEKRGKFSTHSISFSSIGFPCSKSKFQRVEIDADLETVDEEETFWRGVFVVPHQHKILFRKEVEIKTNQLLSLKPDITIDSYRLEDGNK